MDLRQMLRAAALRWKFVMVLTLLGILGAGVLAHLKPPVHTATARIFISAPPLSSTNVYNSYAVSVFLTQRIESYAALAADPRVTKAVNDDVGRTLKPGQSSPELTARIVPNTGILDITATSANQAIAQRFALSDADQLVKLINSLETDASAKNAKNAKSAKSAKTPAIDARVAGLRAESDDPQGAPLPVTLLIGGLLGLLIGAGGAALREVYDRSVRSPKDLGAITHSSVMASMPCDSQVPLHRLVSDGAGTNERMEAFQVLRTNLQFLQLDTRRQVILVSSAVSGEGKTVTATDLAISVAQVGRSVLIVDCDFRRPQVAQLLGLENSVGAMSVLLGQVGLEDCIQRHESGLHLLATGPCPPNPAEILSTQAMRDLLGSLRHDYDVIIIDAPPLLPVTDAAVLAPMTDGVLLVARHGRTSEQQIEQGVAQLESVGAPIVGAILNMVPRGFGQGLGTSYGNSAGVPASRGKARTDRGRGRPPKNIAAFRQGLRGLIPLITPVLTLAVMVLLASKSSTLGMVALAMVIAGLAVLAADLSRAGTWLMVLVLFLEPLNSIKLSGNSQVTAADLVMVLAIGLLIPTIIGKPLHVPALFWFGFAILLTMGIIASTASSIPAVSASQVFRLVVGAFTLPVFYLWWKPAKAVVVQFAVAYMFGCVFSVAYGLTQGPVIGDPRYIGFTTHPNYLGLSCLLGATLVPYVVHNVKQAHTWIFWGAGLICAYGVWISGSRAALLILIMCIGLYPIRERSVRAAGFLAATFAVGLLLSGKLLSNNSDSNALGRLLGNGTAEGSDQARKDIFTSTLQSVKEHPLLGNGFDGSIGAHNIYLQVAFAVGLIGLAGYLIIMWTAIRPLFFQAASHRLAFPVFAYLATGPFLNTLWDRLIWSVVGLAFLAKGQAEEEQAELEAASVEPAAIGRQTSPAL